MTRKFSMCLLALSTLLISLNSPVNAQTPVRPDPERDVEVTSAYEGTTTVFVFGKMTNKSAINQPCVRVVFDLVSRQSDRSMGTFPVYAQNLAPGEVRDFRSRLPMAAGARVKFVSECEWPGEDPANIPYVVKFTATPGRVFQGQSVTLTWRTHNADGVVVTWRDPSDQQRGANAEHPGRPLELSGSMRFLPKRTTRYDLEVKKGYMTVLTDVIVEVIEPPRIRRP